MHSPGCWARHRTLEQTRHESDGIHFEYTIETTGVYRYGCEQHESLGQRGTIVVQATPND
ncbi:plastocyanin/azurin family copper-binding protein [Salinigranum salinum]|uniref:plastocyanin/azurin family copper-binding protein n=1 Tax=Salinigranum salinum TaxID=1364937 RepID=UPI0037427503